MHGAVILLCARISLPWVPTTGIKGKSGKKTGAVPPLWEKARRFELPLGPKAGEGEAAGESVRFAPSKPGDLPRDSAVDFLR